MTSGYGWTVTEGVTYPAVHRRIIEAAYPRQVYRKMLIQITQPNNPRFEIPRENGDTSFTVNEVGEAQEIKIDNPQITTSICEAFEIGEGFGITKNELLFSKIDIVGFKPQKLGRKIGNTVDLFIANLIAGAVPVANIVPATGTSLLPGAAIPTTIAGTVGHYDLMRAIRILQQNQVPATDLICNPIGWEMLMVLPIYKSLNFWGEQGYMMGSVGHIEGMRVHVTTNCPAGEMHVLSVTDESFSNQYVPTGFFLLVHDVQTESIYNPAKRQNEIYATMFYTACIARAQNLAKITYTGTPYG
jgi:hypothetical protein